jgi:hypothetical protein
MRKNLIIIVTMSFCLMSAALPNRDPDFKSERANLEDYYIYDLNKKKWVWSEKYTKIKEEPITKESGETTISYSVEEARTPGKEVNKVEQVRLQKFCNEKPAENYYLDLKSKKWVFCSTSDIQNKHKQEVVIPPTPQEEQQEQEDTTIDDIAQEILNEKEASTPSPSVPYSVEEKKETKKVEVGLFNKILQNIIKTILNILFKLCEFFISLLNKLEG